jgi:hypothetical protein
MALKTRRISHTFDPTGWLVDNTHLLVTRGRQGWEIRPYGPGDGPTQSIGWLEDNRLLHAVFDSRADALSSLEVALAVASSAPPAPPARPSLRRTGPGAYVSACGLFAVCRVVGPANDLPRTRWRWMVTPTAAARQTGLQESERARTLEEAGRVMARLRADVVS